MPPHQGPKAVSVQTCRYCTWEMLLERHGLDMDKARAEYDRCLGEGLWEQHGSTLFVLVDCEFTPPVKVEL